MSGAASVALAAWGAWSAARLWIEASEGPAEQTFAVLATALTVVPMAAVMLTVMTWVTRLRVLLVVQALLAAAPFVAFAWVVVDERPAPQVCDPGPPPAGGARPVDVVCGKTCLALLEDGTATRWSWVPGVDPGPSVPVLVGHDVAAVEARPGEHAACLVSREGQVSCAGRPIAGVEGAVSVSVGWRHACALLADGGVSCFGEPLRGEGGEQAQRVAGLDDVVQLASGWRFTCARRGDGSVWCWGSNFRGSLGRPPSEGFAPPTPVEGVVGATSLTAHLNRVCARGPRGERCWGEPGEPGAWPRGRGDPQSCAIVDGQVLCHVASGPLVPVVGLAGVERDPETPPVRYCAGPIGMP
ncbi:MAG: hypothetical protein KC621_17660 [Myxococcales bacterium]|nr:hypothetical protein [Myxococcales bacterium]